MCRRRNEELAPSSRFVQRQRSAQKECASSALPYRKDSGIGASPYEKYEDAFAPRRYKREEKRLRGNFTRASGIPSSGSVHRAKHFEEPAGEAGHFSAKPNNKPHAYSC
jgi:hypothetical protein